MHAVGCTAPGIVRSVKPPHASVSDKRASLFGTGENHEETTNTTRGNWVSSAMLF